MSGTSPILAAPPPKKIARVQPTPHVVRPIPTKATTATPSSSAYPAASSSSVTPLAKPTPLPTSSPIAKPTPLLTTTQPQPQQQSFTPKPSEVAQPKLDPMKALSSLSKNPLSNEAPTTTEVSKPRTSLLTVVHSTLPGYKPKVTQSSGVTKPAVPTVLSEVKRKNITSYSKPKFIDLEDDTDDDYPSSPEPNLNIKKEASINVTTKVGS